MQHCQGRWVGGWVCGCLGRSLFDIAECFVIVFLTSQSHHTWLKSIGIQDESFALNAIMHSVWLIFLHEVDMMGSQQPVSQLQATKAFGGNHRNSRTACYIFLKHCILHITYFSNTILGQFLAERRNYKKPAFIRQTFHIDI